MMKYALIIFWCCPLVGLTQSSPERLKNHVDRITKDFGFRTFDNPPALNKTANYIDSVFSTYADTSYFQEFEVNGLKYKNVVCQFKGKKNQKIVIGAHYDSCGDQEGADDNASGVAGLLELARLMQDTILPYSVELVAYSLEEPPFFRTENMGSFIHAQSIKDQEILGMVCLEMIGFFDESENSQTYPVSIMSKLYGTQGNFIALVSKTNPGYFTRHFNKSFNGHNTIRSVKFSGPPSLPGIDFSDHLNYWKFGISALMITDTAFYRNKNYHEKSDTIELLNFTKMAQVVNGVFQSIQLN